MKKKLAMVAGGVLGLGLIALGGTLAIASQSPDVLVVERQIEVRATPADVHPFLDDFRAFVTWMPWAELDPSQTVAFSDPASGAGAWYTWQGNADVGRGKMTLVASAPHEVTYKLEFFEPFNAVATSALIVEATPGAPERSTVTWAFQQDADLMFKVMCLFMDMDAMLGADFERGLAKLQPLAEAAATSRRAAELANAAEPGPPDDPPPAGEAAR